FLLVGRVALDCLDEIGDEVVATLQLNVDLGPGVFRLDLLAHEAVVSGDGGEDQHDRHDDESDDQPGFHGQPFLDQRPGRRRPRRERPGRFAIALIVTLRKGSGKFLDTQFTYRGGCRTVRYAAAGSSGSRTSCTPRPATARTGAAPRS